MYEILIYIAVGNALAGLASFGHAMDWWDLSNPDFMILFSMGLLLWPVSLAMAIFALPFVVTIYGGLKVGEYYYRRKEKKRLDK